MSVATSTAIILGTTIGAGSSIAGAAIASHSAKNAAKTQAASADKALALEREQYQQQQQNLAPYRGLSAVLPQLMGRAGQGVTSTGWGQYQAPTSTGNPFASLYQGGQSQPPSPPMGHAFTPTPDGGQVGGQPGGLVTLRAPDGTTQQVPQAQVPHFLSRGATMVSS